MVWITFVPPQELLLEAWFAVRQEVVNFQEMSPVGGPEVPGGPALGRDESGSCEKVCIKD